MKVSKIYFLLLFPLTSWGSEEQVTQPSLPADVYCNLEYTVTKLGKTKDIIVHDCGDEENTKEFSDAAIKAAEEYVYDPKIEDGRPVDVEGVTIKIGFWLEKQDKRGLLGLATVVQGADLNSEAIEKLKWQHGKSENFSVYSDMAPRKVLPLLHLVEDFASFCQMVLGIPPQDRRFEMNLFVAAKSKTWEALGEDPSHVYRLLTNRRQISAVIRTDSSFTGLDTQASEARVHIFKTIANFLIQRSPQAKSFPFWYKDGMTWYLATFERNGDYLTVGQLNAVQGRLRSLNTAIRSVKEYDLDEVILRQVMPPRQVGEGTRTYLDRMDEISALNLMLVHYFYSNDVRQAQLNTYLTLLIQGRTNLESMIEATGLSISELGNTLRKYMKSRKRYAQRFDYEALNARLKELQDGFIEEPNVEPIEAITVIDHFRKLVLASAGSQ